MSESYIGTVKFVSDRGFLFLVPDGGVSQDVFAHVSEFERNGLREPEAGEKYQFEVVQRPKGLTAVNIRPVV